MNDINSLQVYELMIMAWRYKWLRPPLLKWKKAVLKNRTAVLGSCDLFWTSYRLWSCGFSHIFLFFNISIKLLRFLKGFLFLFIFNYHIIVSISWLKVFLYWSYLVCLLVSSFKSSIHLQVAHFIRFSLTPSSPVFIIVKKIYIDLALFSDYALNSFIKKTWM